MIEEFHLDTLDGAYTLFADRGEEGTQTVAILSVDDKETAEAIRDALNLAIMVRCNIISMGDDCEPVIPLQAISEELELIEKFLD